MINWLRCKKNLLRFIVAAIFVFALARIYYRVTDDFRISNITYEMAYHPEWEITPLNWEEQKKLEEIVSLPFSYIGKGAQSYAFASEDDKYVLKFFKFKHLKPSLLVGILPKLPLIGAYQEREIKRKERKLNGVFKGYKLAFDRNRKESGLIFVQLNPNRISKEIVVKDKLGLQRTIDLGSVVYVIQEKGQTLRSVLSRLLSKNHLDLAKQRIGQILQLYMSEYRKGIFDHDHGVMHNIGFVGEKPIHLDVGKLQADDQILTPEKQREDLLLVASKIKIWIKHNFPQHYVELKEDIDQKLDRLLSP